MVGRVVIAKLLVARRLPAPRPRSPIRRACQSMTATFGRRRAAGARRFAGSCLAAGHRPGGIHPMLKDLPILKDLLVTVDEAPAAMARVE
ncbi:MAG: hypothetical protein FJX57_11520, partial [Alphaproteobacteria bacterium]|nr:hypothetical protein [Alphaproteobacteria bacterium]